MSGREVVLKTTDKQKLAWHAWNNDAVDDLIYGGSAGGGKTVLAGQVLTGTAMLYPGSKQFLGRKELKTLMQTSFITLTRIVFPQYGLLPDRDWRLDGKYNVVHFKNGSSIDLLDLSHAPSDPLYDRFGSSEYTRGWIEEASETSFAAYDVLKSRVGRWMNREHNIKSKLGLSLNPSQDWPYRLFYKPWDKAGRPIDPYKPLVSVRSFVDGKAIDRTFVFIPALYKDNPFTAGEYANSLATISDPVLKARLMEGDWEYASANDTLFLAATIADIFTVSIKPSTEKFLIVDAARFGGDKIVLNLFVGWESFKIDLYINLKTTQTAEKIRTLADQYGVPRENILIDEDGIGGGVLDLVPGAIGFHGGASPFGKVGEKEVKENYENLRSQCIYHLAAIARDRKLSVTEPNIQTRELIAQDLQQMKRRDSSKDGKLKVVKKEDMKAALGRSPDCGDTLMMRSYFDLRKREEALSGNGAISIYIPED